MEVRVSGGEIHFIIQASSDGKPQEQLSPGKVWMDREDGRCDVLFIHLSTYEAARKSNHVKFSQFHPVIHLCGILTLDLK